MEVTSILHNQAYLEHPNWPPNTLAEVVVPCLPELELLFSTQKSGACASEFRMKNHEASRQTCEVQPCLGKKKAASSPDFLSGIIHFNPFLNTSAAKDLKIQSYVCMYIIDQVQIVVKRYLPETKNIYIYIHNLHYIIFKKCVPLLNYLKYCTSSHPHDLAIVLRAAIGSNVPCSEVQRRSNKSCVTEGFGMILWRKWRVSKSIIEEVWY